MHLRTRLLPALVGLMLVLQLVIPYRGWTVLFVGLAGLWLVAYLWARSLTGGLGLRRETRFGWQQVGDTMLERFTLVNDGRAPAVWVELADHSTMPGIGGQRATRIGGSTSFRWHHEFVCTQRGMFTLGPTTLRSGDPFGIYSVEVHDSAAASLLVLPPIVALPEIQIATGGQLHEGRPGDRLLVQTVSAGRVSAYRPGDSLRWIHWPTSARRDSLYVRRFDTASSGDWWIVLDLDQQAQAGQGRQSTVEHGVILAASLAERANRNGRTVGLVSQAGGADWIWLPPRSGPAHRWEILRALTLAAPGPVHLSELLQRLRPSLGQPTSLVLITASRRVDWIAGLLPLIAAGAVPTVLLLDWASFGGTGDQRATIHALAAASIRHSVIPRSLLDLPEARREPWKGIQPGEYAWEQLG